MLAGAGRSFCAGHDLGAIVEHESAPGRHFSSPRESLTLETATTHGRLAPRPLFHRRSGAGARLRHPDRCRLDHPRRHPRPVGARADLGHVGSAPRTCGALDGQGTDVHEPSAERCGRRLDRARRSICARRRSRRRRRRSPAEIVELAGHQPDRQASDRRPNRAHAAGGPPARSDTSPWASRRHGRPHAAGGR